MTGGACDPNCCCDLDCPKVVVERWKMNPIENCKEYHKKHTMVSFDDCSTAATRRQASDLQIGLGYFGKVLNLMMCSVKSGEIIDTQKFIEELPRANTSA